ncbi:MAG TPA: hypothetical protein VMV10_22630 [Pirellulales bacterium]|nr:hypothetical protein [Pirellulales bacterium]
MESVFVSICLAFCSAAPREGATNESRLDDLRIAVASARSKMRSLRVKARLFNLANDPKNYVVIDAIAAGPRRLVSISHYTDNILLRDTNDSRHYFEPGAVKSYYPFRRTYEVTHRFSSVAALTDKIRRYPLFEGLGWWPPDDATAPPKFFDAPWFTHEVLASKDAVLEEARSTIDGLECDVLSVPGVHRLWFDARRRTLVRRERYAGQPLKPVAICVLSDYREVIPGLWLPYEIVRELPAVPLKSRFLVDRYSINDVKSEDFAFDPPPGTIVADRDTGSATQLRGGFDHLDFVARSVKALAGARGKHVSPAAGVGWRAAAGLSAAVVSFFIVARLPRGRRVRPKALQAVDR